MLHRALVLCLVLALSLVSLSALPTSRGEHTPHHRYFFVGVVATDSGKPVCGITVRAYEADSIGSVDRDRSAPTDWSGQYEIQLHLHSGLEPEAQPPDVGKSVIVTVGSTTRTVTVQQNDGNPNGWGQLTVDILVPDSVVSPGPCLQQVLLYAGASVGVLATVVFVVWYLRRPHTFSKGRGDLLSLPGVTRMKARELRSAGIRNRKELAAADPDEIAAKTDLTAKQARALVKRANEGESGNG